MRRWDLRCVFVTYAWGEQLFRGQLFRAQNTWAVFGECMTVANEKTGLAGFILFGQVATIRQASITGLHRLIAEPQAPASTVEPTREQGVDVDIAMLKDE